jgi:hypothetical protein
MSPKSETPKQECYGCSLPGTTDEHVPPLCFFPEKKDLPEGLDFRKSLIKVPSCENHNSKKSRDDEYIHYIINMSLGANEHSHYHFKTKIMRAINRKPTLINRILSRSKKAYLRDPIKKNIYESRAIEVEYKRIENALILLARGLYYYHYRTKWSGRIEVYTEFIVSSGHENSSEHNKYLALMFKSVEKYFEPAEKFGENPDIFFYQVVNAQPNFHKIIQTTFYGGVQIIFLLGKMVNPPFDPDAASTGTFPLPRFRFLISSQRSVVGTAG